MVSFFENKEGIINIPFIIYWPETNIFTQQEKGFLEFNDVQEKGGYEKFHEMSTKKTTGLFDFFQQLSKCSLGVCFRQAHI